MKGVLITYRESEGEARRYLSEASLNKKDLILDFSVVKTEKPLACPRESTLLEISLTGIAGELPLLQGPGQEAAQNPKDQASIIYRIRRNPGSPAKISGPQYSIDSYRWTLPASQIESDHPEMRQHGQGGDERHLRSPGEGAKTCEVGRRRGERRAH